MTDDDEDDNGHNAIEWLSLMRVGVHLIKNFLRLQHISESLGGLVKIQIAMLCPQSL